MPEPRSPLETLVAPGRFGAHALSPSPASIGARQPVSLWQASGWDDFAAAIQPLLSGLGLEAPADYRTVTRASRTTLRKTAPDRMLIEGCEDISRYRSHDLVLVDLSHSRTAITLSGAPARTILAQCCSVDVGARAFRPGEFIQTGIHHVAVLIRCSGADAFEIFVPVTWAASIWQVICANAEPFGYVVAERERMAGENRE